MLQRVAKPSCGSELVFLDLYPKSLQPNEAQGKGSFCCLTPAEGDVLKSGGACQCVSCAGWSLRLFPSSHTLKKKKKITDNIKIASNIHLTINTVYSLAHYTDLLLLNIAMWRDQDAPHLVNNTGYTNDTHIFNNSDQLRLPFNQNEHARQFEIWIIPHQSCDRLFKG